MREEQSTLRALLCSAVGQAGARLSLVNPFFSDGMDGVCIFFFMRRNKNADLYIRYHLKSRYIVMDVLLYNFCSVIHIIPGMYLILIVWYIVFCSLLLPDRERLPDKQSTNKQIQNKASQKQAQFPIQSKQFARIYI